MSMPYGLGEATIAGTALQNANERDTQGIPLYCRNNITINDNGTFNAPIFSTECVYNILAPENYGPKTNNKGKNHVLTQEDVKTVQQWWLTHTPDNRGYRTQFEQYTYISQYIAAAPLVGMKIADLDGLDEKGISRPKDVIDDILAGPQALQSSLQSTQKMLQWLSDSYNWMRVGAAFGGIVLILMGGRRMMERDNETASE